MTYFRLWAACLALLPLAICPVFAQAPPKAPSPTVPTLTGLITKISIVGLKNISLDTVQPKLTLKVGDAYTPEAAAKGTAAIKGIGFFYAVTDKEIADPAGGVNVVYTVSENPVVQAIKFTANTPNGQPPVPAADLIAQMKTHVGDVLNTNVLVSDLSNLFNHGTGYVTKLGYAADVSNSINLDPKTGVLAIPLVEYYIKSIEATGNSRVKTAVILAQMHSKPGGLFSKTSLDEDMARLYETGDFRAVNYQASSGQPGEITLKLTIVEQPAATGKLDEKQGKIIPFLYDPMTVQYPLIQVSINGKSPLPFILDTGTSAALVLDPWAAKELSLKVSGKTKLENGVTFTRVPINEVVLQGQDQNNSAVFDIKEVAVADLSLLSRVTPSPRIAGVVGLGLLKTITSRIDFAAKTLTVWTAPHPPLDISNGTVLPLRGTPDGHFTVRAVLAPETYAELNVDTGSNDTQLPLSALSVLHPTAITPIHYEQRVDETIVSPEIRLASLMIGKLRVANVEASTFPPSSRPSLGLDILADYRMTLDAPNGQLIMEPTTAAERYPHGVSGLGVQAMGDGWVVSEFSDKSPAQAAGLQIGDHLVSIAGTKVQGLSETALGKLFAVRLGTSLQVVIHRSGKDILFSWVPVDKFNAQASAIDGLPMQKPYQGSWVVLEVMQGCPGDKAGIQAGDILTKIDGETTASMPLDRFAALTNKPVVTLEVVRSGAMLPFMVSLTVAK